VDPPWFPLVERGDVDGKKHGENHGENHGKTMGKPWENHGKTMGNQDLSPKIYPCGLYDCDVC